MQSEARFDSVEREHFGRKSKENERNMRKASREPNEQREQSQACLSYAERRMRKASRQMDAFDDAIARSLERTAVVKITLTEPPVGKRKQYDKEGEEMKYGRIE